MAAPHTAGPLAALQSTTGPKDRVRLGVTYDGNNRGLCGLLSLLADFVELLPEHFTNANGFREIHSVSPPLKVIAHGDGLAVANPDRRCQDYSQVLDQLFEHFPVEWHSDHLSGVESTGQNLDLISAHVQQIQHRYKVPFLLEPVDAETEFVNAISERTGCGLLLNAADPGSYCKEFRFEKVREIHFPAPLSDDVLQKSLEVITRCPNLAVVTYKTDPVTIEQQGYEGFCATLSQLRKAIRKF